MWYCKNILIAIDQLFASILGLPCDWTLSAYASFFADKGIKKWIVIKWIIDNILFRFQKNHCSESLVWERQRKDTIFPHTRKERNHKKEHDKK